MTNINFTIQNIDSVLVVDSRLIAEELGIAHETVFRNIKNYQSKIEQFGHIRFKSGTVTNSVGAVNEVRFAYLNEDQATFLMTLSRNTPQVVDCKVKLVKGFSQAKKLIESSFQNSTKPQSNPALQGARDVRDIYDLLPENPRLAQLFVDSTVNYYLGNQLAIAGTTQPELKGVVEIAEDMGFKTDESTRVKLGMFVKNIVGHLAQSEKRLCNGTMRSVNCYPDTLQVQDAVKRFFS